MSWIDRLRQIVARVVAPTAPSPAPYWWSGRTQAGVYVDGDSMFKTAVVWACVSYLTRAVGQLPWRVLKERPGGVGSERAPTHPVDWLLHKRPNPEMGAMTFRQTMMSAALTRGNAYAEIQRDARGVPVALWPIATDRVQPKRRETGELYYRIDNGAGQFSELDAMNIFHLRGFPGPDGVMGLDVVSYAAQSIGWAQATELFGASFFGEGMTPAGVVIGLKGGDKDQRTRTKAEFEDLYKGPRKAHRTAYLDAGQDWKRISVQPNEAQFIETRQHQVEEICRWFGVPPHKVMHLLRSTNNNIEHQSIEVVIDAVAPWARLLEEEADYKLFGITNRQGFFTKIFLQALMRGDAKARAGYYQLMRNAGALNADEIREFEDMNPLPKGKGGDKYIVQGQYTTLERVGEEPLPPAPPAPADRRSPDDDDDETSGAPPENTQGTRNGSGLPH